MEPYKTIVSLRAVRQFERKPIPDDAVQRILQAGRMSGSSKNSQPWTLVVVRDPETRLKLSRCGDFASHLTGAALAIAIVFDPQFYRGEFDTGRAAQNMMLAAWAGGIGSCIASMHREDDAKAVLGVPQDLRLQHVISFGYPLPQPIETIEGKPRAHLPKVGGRKPMEEIVRYEKW